MLTYVASITLYFIFFSWGWGLISYSLVIILKVRWNIDNHTIDNYWQNVHYPTKLWYIWATPLPPVTLMQGAQKGGTSGRIENNHNHNPRRIL